MFKKLEANDFVSMSDLAQSNPAFVVDLAYGRDDNLLLGQAVYHRNAQLWLYRDFADVVLCAADLCYQRYGIQFILYDGLRTVDAQQAMLKTARVQANQHWLGDPLRGRPPLLSAPGSGAHPRGMAIDIGLLSEDGQILNMGCDFDYLAEDPSPEHNPAHRNHPDLSPEAIQNRAILDNSMQEASQKMLLDIVALPQEWWDFRLPASFYELFAPLCDSDLPEEMKMGI